MTDVVTANSVSFSDTTEPTVPVAVNWALTVGIEMLLPPAIATEAGRATSMYGNVDL